MDQRYQTDQLRLLGSAVHVSNHGIAILTPADYLARDPRTNEDRVVNLKAAPIRDDEPDHGPSY